MFSLSSSIHVSSRLQTPRVVVDTQISYLQLRVSGVRSWRRLRVTTGHCMYGPCQHHAAPGTLPFPALTFSVYDF